VKIWLICAYGPIPGEGWRDYRYTMIGEALAREGHDVIWWTSGFSHHFKQFRSKEWEDRPAGAGFLIRMVPAFGYARNISLARVWHELLFAGRVYLRSRREPRPDLIIAADPPPTIGRMAAWLARRSKCPLIFDVMDLWPELFSLALPRRLRAWAPAIFSPLYALRKGNHAQADGLIALCESYRAMMAGQILRRGAVPSAAIFNGIDVAAFRSAMTDPSRGVDLPPLADGAVRAVYAGTLGENYDVITLIKAAEILDRDDVHIQIVVAGVGPLLPLLKNSIRERQLKSLIYVGSLLPQQLPWLYSQCDIGISAYGSASTVAMPDKVYDYMAAGLPIVNSLRGELAELLEAGNIGLPYVAGDAESLVAALRKLTYDRQLRREMAKRSLQAGNDFDRYAQYGVLPDLIQRVRQHYAEAHRLSGQRARALFTRL
jgi:glycosyltransferase involved in cell wall biosynthesis